MRIRTWLTWMTSMLGFERRHTSASEYCSRISRGGEWNQENLQSRADNTAEFWNGNIPKSKAFLRSVSLIHSQNSSPIPTPPTSLPTSVCHKNAQLANSFWEPERCYSSGMVRVGIEDVWPSVRGTAQIWSRRSPSLSSLPHLTSCGSRQGLHVSGIRDKSCITRGWDRCNM